MDAPEGGAAFSIWEMSAEGLIFPDARAITVSARRLTAKSYTDS